MTRAPLILTDPDLRTELTAPRAIAWMREALAAHARGELIAPARAHTELGAGRLVFTTGALRDRWYGYRSYDTFAPPNADQVVVCQHAATGRVRGLAVGHALGPIRVGAIGAVALDLLGNRHTPVVAVIGSGVQAWHQLWAMSAVRRFGQVRVFSRSAARREAFAARVTDELGLAALAYPSAREAVTGADVVVLATSSPTPVIDADWVSPGTFVTTLGPKQVGRAEFGPELVDRADLAATDSLAQWGAYDPPGILAGTPQGEALTSLGDIVIGARPGRRRDEDVVLFCSVGLAGTEVYLLDRLLAVRGG